MDYFSYKRNILIIIFVVVAICLIVRLFWIQILDDSYKLTAENNAFRYEVQYPARGLIYDRNGELMVDNQTNYDIMVIPRDLEAFDTVDLCLSLNISIDQVRSALKGVNKKKRGYQAINFLKQVPAEVYAVFQEKSYKFPGFYAQVRTVRNYPKQVGGNLFGYIAEVDKKIIKEKPYYQQGDYIGVSGIEEAYEEALGGRKGRSIYLRDVHNRIKESYQEGQYDTAAVAGKNLISSIDANLQAYGEKLMQNKIGSIVAIEPSTGEVLALVSSPSFDPGLLAGLNRNTNFGTLQSNLYKPLFNRTIMSSQNPPGSVFKLANALIGLEEGVVTPSTRYGCAMGYPVGRGVACHSHPSPTDLYQSIQMSCNAYYCYVFRNIMDNPKYPSIDSALMRWRGYLHTFGFGVRLGIDLPSEQPGVLPRPATYERIHGKGRWKSLSIISLAIGQGEIGATPLQLANFSALIANRGYYYTPHVIKEIEGQDAIDEKFRTKHYTEVDKKHFDDIVKGMYLAVHGGPGATARWLAIPGIEMCGKTGTAQNPLPKDHSVFICFAPMDNPKIAIAAYVENAGYGATYAGRIASLMVEMYLKGTVERKDMEDFILSSDLLIYRNEYKNQH